MTSSDYYTDKHGNAWRQVREEELKPGHPVRELLEQQLESWAPNFMDSADRVTSYEDWIEKVEGFDIPDPDSPDVTHRVNLELGSDEGKAPYTTVRRIAQKVAKELRD